MTNKDNKWDKSQEKRLSREAGLLGILTLVVGFILGRSHWPIFLLCVVLLLVEGVRRRAVNEGNRVSAEKKLSETSPVLVLGTLVVTFYAISHSVILIEYSTTLIEHVVIFSLICLTCGTVIMVMEQYSNGAYLDWWSERAIERAHRRKQKFWIWIAAGFKRLSPTEITEEEKKQNDKKRRALQRSNPEPFKIKSSISNPPSFEIGYIRTLFSEMRHWRRSLPIILGTIFLSLHGATILVAFLGSLTVWIGSSVLADNLKYWYFFRPVHDGFMEKAKSKTWKQRLLYQGQSYWVSNTLAFLTIWWVF